jgi:hypothetical protein
MLHWGSVAYCNNNVTNTFDSAGTIPKELTQKFLAASTYGSGGTVLGPYIPISIPYDHVPYDEETLDRWIVNHGYVNEAHFVRAISDISDGVQSIKEGFAFLLLPEPTVVLDLTGIVKITNGVLQSVVGFTKLIIWLCEQ